MKKTLVLAVDRDDDFGVKANVQTPAIGLEAVSDAARALGVADPEDSDVNTVFAAVKVYNELTAEGRDVEIALICGDTKVGHRSDIKIVDELEHVIEKVRPERAILISDGAEDEYVYPMITSRIKVDSVKKVYVKQAPGLEGAFYVITRILRDNDKRKRILAPFGLILMIITMIFMVPIYINFSDTGDTSYIYNSMSVIVVFVIGLILCLYAYRVGDRLFNFAKRMLVNVKSGDPTVIFTILAIMLFFVGILLGLTAAFNQYATDDGQRILIFFSNSLWVLAFAYICNDFGKFLENYIEKKRIVLGFMVGTLMIFAGAFIIQAALDTLAVVFAYDIMGSDLILLEFVIGFVFAAAAAATQLSYKRFLNAQRNRTEQSDAVQ